MSGHDTPANRARRMSTAGKWLVGGLVAAVVVLATGCSDYRISLEEFLAMQEQAPPGAEGGTTTQPATPAPLSAEDQAILNRELGPYRVGPGDVLAIDIIGPDQTGPRTTPGGMGGVMGTASIPGAMTRVDRNGEIRLAHVGKLKVLDMEMEDIEALVLDALVKKQVFTDPDQVSVTVALAAPYTTDVLVNGAAVTPGLVKLRRCERNVLHALSAAGGATQIASGQVTLKRLRTPGEQVTFNLYDPAQLKKALTMAPLENGDIIEVKAAQPNTVFVGGLVVMPGPQPYAPGTHVTVLQALAAASGLRTDLTPRYATLSRQINGRDVHVKLDLDRIQKSKDPNITLAAGDVLWVPFTLETRIEDWLNRNFFFRVGASVNANYGLNYNMPGVDYLNRASQMESNYGRGGGSTLQDTFDPFGFILQNQTLQSLQGR